MPFPADRALPKTIVLRLNVTLLTVWTTSDIIALADHLGFDQFALAGHDRGGRVAYRLLLDNPGRVSRFCAIDIIPTLDAWEEMDVAATVSAFHWSLLAATAPLPEQLIGQNPDLFYGTLLERWASDIRKLDPRAVRAYLDQYRDPARIHAQCEDYRAGATTDRSNDQASRDAGEQLDCPMLLLWGTGYLGDKANSPVASWRKWASDVSEIALDCGHFVVEEEPQQAGPGYAGFLRLNPRSSDRSGAGLDEIQIPVRFT